MCIKKGQFFTDQSHWHLKIIHAAESRLYSFIRSTEIPKPCGTDRGVLDYEGFTAR